MMCKNIKILLKKPGFSLGVGLSVVVVLVEEVVVLVIVVVVLVVELPVVELATALSVAVMETVPLAVVWLT